MTVLSVMKHEPVFLILVIGLILGTIVAVHVVYDKMIVTDNEKQIIHDSSCYQLQDMIAYKQFKYTMNDAEHLYEWKCEK